MIFDPYLEWLGFRTRRPAAGVHVSSTHLVVVAVRRRPLRLVAVGRRTVPRAAVVDGDIRLVEPLAAALRTLVADTRIVPGTPTVAVIHPLHDTVSISPTTGADDSCEVADRAAENIAAVVNGAGLRLRCVDVYPAALARVAELAVAPTVAVDSVEGWSVAVGDGIVEGRRNRTGNPQPTLRLGSDPATTVPVTDLPGIFVPPQLRSALNPGHDAPAVGAALRLFGIGPAVVARPGPVPVGSGWTVQSIDRADPVMQPWSSNSREPNVAVSTHYQAKE